MLQASSDPIAVAAATPYEWQGNAAESLEYQIRFYSNAKGTGDLDQAGGSRDVTIAVTDSWRYADLDITEDLASTMANTPTITAPAGEWQLLGVGEGRGVLTLTAVANSLPAGATHYKILVRSK